MVADTARQALADQIELAIYGEQLKGRILYPQDVAQIAVTVVEQWGCPNCPEVNDA